MKEWEQELFDGFHAREVAGQLFICVLDCCDGVHHYMVPAHDIPLAG